jgi:hypothetical protein
MRAEGWRDAANPARPSCHGLTCKSRVFSHVIAWKARRATCNMGTILPMKHVSSARRGLPAWRVLPSLLRMLRSA